MSKNLSNYDIFTIFSNNKRLILFLLKEGIIQFDINIFNNLIPNKKSLYDTTSPNLKYFLPEIKKFIDTHQIPNNNEEKEENNNFFNINQLHDHINQLYQDYVNDDFEKKRNFGENDDKICQLIQKDMIEEFIIEYNKTYFSLKQKIPASFYETNSFLLTKNSTTLIEYASFYGSTQIFRYLFKNEVELTSSLWFYAIHSDNSELISILEENCPKPDSFKETWIESVKCHHNSMANYFQDKYSIEICYKFFSFFNFSIFKNNNINREITFYYSCKYDYYNLCKILLSTTNVNINYYKPTWIDEIDTIDIEKRIVNYEIKKKLISEKTPFAAACQNGNIDIINLLLLNNKIDINLTNNYINEKKKITKKAPLYISLYNNKFDIVKILLSRPEIDVNFHQISANVSQPALCLAIRKENIEIIKLLLSNPKIDVNIPKKSKKLYQTALYLAVELQNVEIIKLLLSNQNIDVNANCKVSYNKDYISQRTPLSLAVELGRSDIVDLILQNGGVDINEMNLFSLLHSSLFGAEKKTLLYIAVENEQLEVVKFLLKNKDIDVNAVSYICREDGDFDYQRNIDDRYVDFLLSKSKKTALHIAVQYKLVEYVELLLSDPRIDANILRETYSETWSSRSKDEDADINEVRFYDICEGEIKSSSSVLNIALDNYDIEMFKLLLSHPKINDNNVLQTILHSAVNKGNVEIVNLLLSHPKINDNNVLQTILHSAVSKRNVKMVKLLLSHPKINDNNVLKTILHNAVNVGNVEIVKLLLSNPKIDVNFLEKTKSLSQTALHIAVSKRIVEMVELLLSHPKIDVNILQTKITFSNTETKTALHIAYQQNKQEIIDLLLKRNDINVDALDSNGRKPSYYKK